MIPSSHRIGLLVATVSLGGCGLSLDLDPPDRQGGGMDGGGFDAATDGRAPPGDSSMDAAEPCAEDSDCYDSNPCNGLESCTVAGCVAGTPPTCDDMIDCTVDGCDETTGCKHEPDDALCTASEGGHCDIATRGCQYPRCEVGVTCTGTACEAVSCDGTTCVRTPRCTEDELCCDGTCHPADCDGNACTVDACGEPGSGLCESIPVTMGCEDGDPCTTADTCISGMCTAGRPCPTVPYDCVADGCEPGVGCRTGFDPDMTPCDDGNLCTSGEQCLSGVCTGGFSVACVDDDNPCTMDFCDPVLGPCGTVVPDGTGCDDGQACTFMDQCTTGVCRGRPACPAGSLVCNHATCDGSGTCVLTPDPDDTVCGLNRQCLAGRCACADGWNDCDRDGRCECRGPCDGATGLCTGTRSCIETGCTDTGVCCACSGVCVDPMCLSCCMDCDPCAGVTCARTEECCCDGSCAPTGDCAARCATTP